MGVFMSKVPLNILNESNQRYFHIDPKYLRKMIEVCERKIFASRERPSGYKPAIGNGRSDSHI
jgi:hypothetical protein